MPYTLIRSKQVVEEGDEVEISLLNPELADGTLVPFQLFGTGLTLSDFEGLSSFAGSFNMSGGLGSVIFRISSDFVSETSETVQLVLTDNNLGGGLSTSFVIADTSKSPANTSPAVFIVTADVPLVSEGENVTFTIQATNLPGEGLGTVVPYNILGIQEQDLVGNLSLSGNLIFNSQVGESFFSSLELPILTDFTVEGIETIVLLVNPPFPYTLEVTTTVQILDSSVDTLPRITLERFPFTIYENGTYDINAERPKQAKVTLRTVNIPDGFAPTFKLLPVSNSAITFSDFENIGGISNFTPYSSLLNFEGKFPPTVSGVSEIFITAAEDNILEGSELFSVFLPEYGVVSPVIEIFDETVKGELGEKENGVVEIRSARNIANPNVAVRTAEEGFVEIPTVYLNEAVRSANIVLSAVGKSVSKWEGTRGLLSSVSFIQGRSAFADVDSPIYYQPFSYVIRTKQSIENWTKSIKDLVHPAGMVAFGEINIDTELNNIPNFNTSNIGYLNISASLALTADSTDSRLRISNEFYQTNVITIPLLVDLTFRTTELL